MSKKPGRKTELTTELLSKIKAFTVEGKNLKQTAELCGIDVQSLYDWKYKNYLNLGDLLLSWRMEKILGKAINNLDDLQDNSDPKIRLDVAKFVAETLGKKDFSKRFEGDLTSGGIPLILPASLLEKNGINTSQE